MEIPEQCVWRYYSVSIVNFGLILHIVLKSVLLTLNKLMPAELMFRIKLNPEY